MSWRDDGQQRSGLKKKRRPLPREFYHGETVLIARALLGCVLCRTLDGRLLAARIVETEAYLGANDPASHARGGHRSPRNESMYGEGGHAYVYFTYGMHYCLNVVTQQKDLAEAVLLRAAEPLEGIEIIESRRLRARRPRDLTNGPGKLCMALGIDRSLDGVALDGDALFIAPRELAREEEIGISSRVGVDYAGDAAHWPLRFFLKGNIYVSSK